MSDKYTDQEILSMWRSSIHNDFNFNALCDMAYHYSKQKVADLIDYKPNILQESTTHKSLTHEQLSEAENLLKSGKTLTEVAKEFKVCYSTMYKRFPQYAKQYSYSPIIKSEALKRLDEGWKIKDISDALFISTSVIYDWQKQKEHEVI